MKRSPERPRLRKREIVFAVAAGVVAAGGATLILEGDGSGPGSRLAATGPSEMTYQLEGFERIATIGSQDLEITFGDRFSVEADGNVSRLHVAVEDGELVIRPREGRGWTWGDFDSTTISVTMPRLTGVSLTGSGDISVDGVKGDRFSGVIEGGFGGSLTVSGLEVEEAEFVLNGLGEIEAAGTARATRTTINGVGQVQAVGLRSQTAVVSVNGPGEVELTVDKEADVSVRGPGEVDIDGTARCTISTSGPGSVSCGNQDSG